MKLDEVDEFYPFKKEDNIEILKMQYTYAERKFVEFKS